METTTKANSFSAFLRRHLTASLVLATTFVLLMSITVVTFWFAMTSTLNNHLQQQTEVLGNSLATQAAFNATQSILNNDLLSLNVLLTRLVADENIVSARVFNKQDELLAEATSGSSNQYYIGIDIRPEDNHRIYSSSVKFRNEVVGHVIITLDKTPAQKTLTNLSNLLISLAIFVCALALVAILFVSRWLFNPILRMTEVFEALSHGHKDAPLPNARFLEARLLMEAGDHLQRLEWPLPKSDSTNETEQTLTARPQLEIDFDKIFAEEKQRSCVLYISMRHLDAWHHSMTPLQVSNLLTPIYRALFQASEPFYGQVHQYESHSAIVFFRAADSENNLYINAVCSAQLFLGLIDDLMQQGTLYQDAPKIDFHLSLHQGNAAILELMDENRLDSERLTTLLTQMSLLGQSQSTNTLLLSEEVFVLPDIQNKVFTGLPEIMGDEDGTMAYAVKGITEKLTQDIKEKRSSIFTTSGFYTEKTPDQAPNVSEHEDELLNISASRG